MMMQFTLFKLFSLPFLLLLSLLIAAGMLATACSSTSISVAIKDVPACLTAVNNTSRAELQRIIASALNRSTVLLASDALTNSNVLIIERAPRLGMNTQTGQARNERDRPSVFRLVKSGTKCVLTFQGTDKRWVLKNTQCKPIKPAMTVSR